tara:strand:- start:130 stop:3327 length:3198 start_codon:yes stop_codon:yes gene_type:complete
MRADIEVQLKITQPDSPIYFETIATDNPSDIYHELYSTDPFPCSETLPNLHTGNIQSQAVGGTAIIALNQLNNVPVSPAQMGDNTTFNGFCFGNGVESNRIKDEFNYPTILYSPRVSTIIDDYKQERRADTLTYSAPFGHLINGFNDFNLSLGNWKDLDISFGSIQKLFARDSNVLVLQENKVSHVLYGKNLLSDASGGGQVASIPEVLGTQNTYLGEYGISNNPESFAEWGQSVYFTDERRGCVLALDGLTLSEISSKGMRDHFKDFFSTTSRQVKLGAVDPYSQKYNLAGRALELPCDFRVAVKGQVGEGEEPTWLEDGDDFFCGSSAGARCFLIYGSGAWTAQAVDNGSGIAFVTSIVPSSGSGNGGVCVTLTSTGFNANRGFILRFTACGTTMDINVFQRGIPLQITISAVLTTNPQDAGKWIGTEYVYPTYPGPGAGPAVGSFIPPKGDLSTWDAHRGWPPHAGIPSEGDNVTLYGPADISNSGNKGFEEGLNNTLSFLLSNIEYGPNDLATVLSLATPMAAGYNPGEERYEGSFIYLNPANNPYLYLVWDYTDRISAGNVGSSIGKLGENHVELDYGAQVGNGSLTYDANSNPNRFVLKYNNVIVGDTGYVGLNTVANYNALIAAGVPDEEINLSFPYDGLVNNGSGTLNFKKYSADLTKGELVAYTKTTPSDGWDAGVVGATLTSFNINPIARETETGVCADTAATPHFHDGVGAAPMVGNTIYTVADGSQPMIGGGAYFATGVAGPANTWIVVDSRGMVQEVGDCACAEVAIPIVEAATIIVYQNQYIDLMLQATNNPTQWQIIDTCVQYVLYGGTDGAVFSGTNCLTPEAQVITVPKGETRVVCFEDLTVSQLSGSADATFTSGPVCNSDLLPQGMSLDASGSLTGEPSATGHYEFVVRATNCFGDSADQVIIVDISAVGYNRFLMDGVNAHEDSADACAALGAYTLFYHDGMEDTDTEYPLLNNVVYFYDEYVANQHLESVEAEGDQWAHYQRFNGGNKWYKMDNNFVIKIAIDGTVIDIFDCTSGEAKTTEAGAGGFAPDTIKTTGGASNKTLE